MQPPSGGCVLKRLAKENVDKVLEAAAFGRLCVETVYRFYMIASDHRQPPSGGCVLKLQTILLGRLQFVQPPSGGCVLKLCSFCFNCVINRQPPSGGCVLKPHKVYLEYHILGRSRLRAAVC